MDVLVKKLDRAVRRTRAQSVIIGGGVSANRGLRAALTGFRIPVHFPPMQYCTDNAAMTAGLAHVLLREGQTAPLDLAFCPSCALVQITETVPPEILFGRDYPYFSSVSPALLDHFRRSALSLIESRRLGPESFVLEVASNDGYMLKNFVERGIPVLGVDPAEGPAGAAQVAGVPTRCAFFGRELAWQLVDEGRVADVVLANNVLAHVPDLNGFVAGVRLVMKGGVLYREP